MVDYEDLNDQEKYIDFPDEFIAELRRAYQSGEEDEALNRAEEQGIDIREIIS